MNSRNDSKYHTAVCLVKPIAVYYPEPILEVLRVDGTPVTEYMSETNIASMFEDADISLVQERDILQHLRHQFGTKTVVTRTNVQMLCEGHTPVKRGFAMYTYKDGEEEELLDYSYKDTEKKVEVQIARQLTNAKIDPTKVQISRIDLIMIGGADHGWGAMQDGITVVIVFVDAPSYAFDIALAEVICQKDTTGVM
jgi:hypothetical protein